MTPRLPLTVDIGLWEKMATEVRPEFADSYLSGSRQTASTLIPHTITATERLRQNRYAMQVIHDAGLKLIEPLRFGHPDRPDTAR